MTGASAPRLDTSGSGAVPDAARLRSPGRSVPLSREELARRALTGNLRLVIWTSIPTHHHSAFFAALRESGVHLKVCYFKQVTDDRLKLGWQVPEELPAGECYVEPGPAALHLVDEWSDHVHIVPGANTGFLLRLCVRLSMREVPWLHWSEPGRPRRPWGAKAVLRRAYATIVNEFSVGALAMGDLARKDFERWGIDPALIRFLPYSVAPLEAPTTGRAVTSGGTLRFMQVGALCPRKGVDVLLEAFAAVHGGHPHVRLELVGYDQAGGTYQELARRLGVQDVVTFTSSVPSYRVAEAMARADILTLVSRFDGWGVVLNEAASLGKALISTQATGAAHHLIRTGENGYVVPPGDPRTLTLVMETYCREPQLAERHGRRSREIFADFTPTANVQRLRTALWSLLGPREPA
jgi:glycosyltransferase involved in cell wall biosynthesis